jgi:hypothetical protein
MDLMDFYFYYLEYTYSIRRDGVVIIGSAAPSLGLGRSFCIVIL